MKKAIFAAIAAFAVSAAANASVIAVEHDAFVGATVINFDDVSLNTALSSQYAAQGVTNMNATVRGANGMATTASFAPAFSGQNMVGFGASIQFASAVDRVGAWIYKFNGTQFLTALDADMNVLMSVSQNWTSQDSDRYDFVGIASSTANIAYVVISNKDLSVNPQWDIYGATTMFDDLTFGGQQEVPEPASIALLGLGVTGLAAARRKKAAKQA